MTKPFLTPALRDLETYIAATRGGVDPSLSLLTRHPWGEMFGAMLVKIIELSVPQPVENLALSAGDYRRAAALACAAATEDTLGVDSIILEAAEAGRMRHALVAAALSVAQGMRADTPEGMERLRHNVALLAAIEQQEEEDQDDEKEQEL